MRLLGLNKVLGIIILVFVPTTVLGQTPIANYNPTAEVTTPELAEEWQDFISEYKVTPEAADRSCCLGEWKLNSRNPQLVCSVVDLSYQACKEHIDSYEDTQLRTSIRNGH